jgi:hypothetical protein
MTIVNASSIFAKNEFKEMVEEWSRSFSPKDFTDYVNVELRQLDFVEGVDYGQVLKARKMNKSKNLWNNNSNINWFGTKN